MLSHYDAAVTDHLIALFNADIAYMPTAYDTLQADGKTDDDGNVSFSVLIQQTHEHNGCTALGSITSTVEDHCGPLDSIETLETQTLREMANAINDLVMALDAKKADDVANDNGFLLYYTLVCISEILDPETNCGQYYQRICDTLRGRVPTDDMPQVLSREMFIPAPPTVAAEDVAPSAAGAGSSQAASPSPGYGR